MAPWSCAENFSGADLLPYKLSVIRNHSGVIFVFVWESNKCNSCNF